MPMLVSDELTLHIFRIQPRAFSYNLAKSIAHRLTVWTMAETSLVTLAGIGMLLGARVLPLKTNSPAKD